MALVTVDDLVEYMSDISLTINQQAAAQLILDATQQQLESFLNRPLEQVQVREKVRTDHTGECVLSYSPIQQILRVTALNATPTNPDEVTPAVMQVTPAERVIDLQPLQNNLVPGGFFIGRPWTWYIVEYLAGGHINIYQDMIKLGILRVAAREMTMNHDDVLSIKDDFAREPANAAEIRKGWQPEDLAPFERLRRRTVYR